MQVGYVDDSKTESRVVLEIRDQKVIDIHIQPDESVKIDQTEDIYSNLAYIEDSFVVDRLTNFVPYRGEAIENHRGFHWIEDVFDFKNVVDEWKY